MVVYLNYFSKSIISIHIITIVHFQNQFDCLKQPQQYYTFGGNSIIINQKGIKMALNVQKADNTWPRSKPDEAKIIFSQLDKQWKACKTTVQHHDIKKINEMLIKWLQLTIRDKIKNPDWRSIFSNHIHVLSKSGQSKIAFYYFHIASQLFKQMTPSNLVNLLSKDPPMEIFNTDEQLKYLKLNYQNVFDDPTDFSFAEKIMINICKFFAEDNDSKINPEEIFKYYMICFQVDDFSLIAKHKKLILGAFQFYCYYCLKNIKNINKIELNLFRVLEILLCLYGSKISYNQNPLYRSISNFISLMRVEIFQNYVLQYAKYIKVPQIVEKLINLIDSFETRYPATYNKNFLQKIGINFLYIHHLDQYINVGSVKQIPRTKKEGILWILSLHEILKKIKLKHFDILSKQQVEQKINYVCSQCKGDTDQIINWLLKDTTVALNDKVLPILRKIGLSQIKTLDKKQAKQFIKWTPLIEIGIFFIQKLNNYENIIAVLSQYYQYLIYSLLLKHFFENKPQTKEDVLHFTKIKYGKFLRNTKISPFGYVNLMYTLNNLVTTQYYQVAFEIISTFFECIDPKILIAEPQFYSALVPFRFTYMFRQIAIQTIKYRLFFINILEIQIRNLYKAIADQQIHSKRSEYRLLHIQLIGLIGEYYSLWKETVQEDFLDMILGVQSEDNQHIFLDTISVICRETLAVIAHQLFYQEENYRKVLINYLDFLKDVMFKKSTLTVQEKVDLVDFTFNVKTQLSILLKKIKKEDKNLLSFIQETVDFVDQIEYQFLDYSASEYIHRLRHSFQDDNKAPLCLVAAVAVKHIFYVVNPNYQSCSLIPQHKNKQQQQSDQFNFIYDEIEMTSFKLKQIKKNCLSFQKIFENMKFKFTKLSKEWYEYDISLKDEQILSLCGYLHDLTYLGFISGVNSFKRMVISFRLSIIRKYLGLQIYVFQMGRLIMLQILTSEQQQQMRALIDSLNSQNVSSIHPRHHQIVKMMLNGNFNQELFSNSRVFRIIYYLKQSPLVYINSFKSIFHQLASHIFNFTYLPFEIAQETVVLKMSKSQRTQDKKYDKWIKQCWNEDWSYLRMMIIFLRKIIKQSLELNQISRLRCFLLFSITVHIRSGHLDELSLPFQVLIMKKKEINFMRIADSLRLIVKSDIQANQDKKLDRILCKKRNSVSFGLKMQNLGKIINKAYEKAGSIGFVLRDIIFYLVCDTLNINQWQKIETMLQMPIYSQSDTIAILKRYRLIGEKTIDAQILNANILCRQISILLFQDFRAAAALRDYIACFLDFSMQNLNSISRDHSQQIDNLILTLSLIFEEFNYTIKQFWATHNSQISINQNSLEKNSHSNFNFLESYSYLQNNYFKMINDKILLKNTIPWPMNLIFPLGSYVYNIACRGSLLITYVKKTDFEDKLEVVKDILISRKQLFKQKNFDKASNYRKGKGLDDQLGKVLLSTDIGIIDSEISNFAPNSIFEDIIKIHPSLLKFLPFQKSYFNHLQQFIKRYKLGSFELIKQKLQLATSTMSDSREKYDDLVLYIHQKYLPFPFQCIGSVKKQAVFRVPSISYIQQTKQSRHSFNIHSCKYLVNTKNDLPLSTIKFQAIRQKYKPKNWTGIIGRIPPLQQMIHLFERDIFLYMGHGNGMEHLPSTQYINFQPKCLMLVFGCSSAKMIHEESEPFGCTFDFLLRSCPAYLGCLWDITDVDSDAVTEYLIMNSQNENLYSVLARARSKCHFPYLNSASMVIYGLPCSIHHQQQ